ncbi:MAG TPA: MFS transporter [Solirubrobacterales bacterium]|nr:MFS transporter [Solirubrobacterales bacterium]
MPIAKRMRVLREPDFRRLFVGRTTSFVGDGMAPVAIAFAVLDLGGSATDLGIVFAAHSLLLIALVLVAGVVGDRVSPRLSMLGADLLSVAATAAMAALLLSGAAEIWHLVVLYAIQGGATAFFKPASGAIVPQIVPVRRLQEANALLELSRSLGKVVGPALAGIMLGLGSPGSALALDAATFAVSALSLVGLRAPPAEAGEEGTSFFGELRHGWREFSARSWLVAVVIGAAISNAIYYPAFQVLGPTVAQDSLGGSSSWAVIATAMGVGAVAGGAVALSIRPRRPLLVGEGLVILIALPLIALAVPASTAVIAIAAFVAGAVGSLAQILFETAWVQHIPPPVRTRVSAYDWFGSLALEPLGLALVGPLVVAIGTSEALWLSSVVVTVCVAAAWSVPSVRRLEVRVDEPTPTPPPRPIEAGD